jgi:pentatricopeptide repeat protein
MFVFCFIGFQGIIILDYFVILCFGIGSNIFNDPFLKLALHMSWIIIFCKIMNPYMDCRHNKVTYMLCIFKRMLSSGCRRSIIKLSNVCSCALKCARQKVGARNN